MNVVDHVNEGSRFFAGRLAERDAPVADALEGELRRQREQIELIASENIVSRAVLDAAGSVATNKYAEGYPGRRYYGGCEFVDAVEEIAIERACRLFGCRYANVQPHSGAQANQAVLYALAAPGDTILGMSLSAGGHLTHGARPTLSGKWFKAVAYGVRGSDALIDMDEVEALAREHRPKVIIAGASAYSRFIDFAAFRAIADEYGACLMVDMAHVAGLVAGGVHPSPLPHAHVVTTTTHKTLRGPRGGLILTDDEALSKRINSAVFPGIQGGPLMHVIAAKAVALGEALTEDFKVYARSVVANARRLGATLTRRGFAVVSGGTDNHLLLVDVRPYAMTGKLAQALLESANITCNKNALPDDPNPPTVTSAIRLGTAACTTRGFGEDEFAEVGELIAGVLGTRGEADSSAYKERAIALCRRHPIY